MFYEETTYTDKEGRKVTDKIESLEDFRIIGTKEKTSDEPTTYILLNLNDQTVSERDEKDVLEYLRERTMDNACYSYGTIRFLEPYSTSLPVYNNEGKIIKNKSITVLYEITDVETNIIGYRILDKDGVIRDISVRDFHRELIVYPIRLFNARWTTHGDSHFTLEVTVNYLKTIIRNYAQE